MISALNFVLGWPLILFISVASILCTVALRGIQFRSFVAALRATISPPPSADQEGPDLSPLQAFISTLNTNLGNGSIAGTAVAVACGGPGAAFWMVLFGLLLMAVRFAEVYLSTWYGMQTTQSSGVGGPMRYLEQVPFIGKILAYLFAFFCLSFGLVSGNMMQANSIRVSLFTTWGVSPLLVALLVTLFVLYVVLGGSRRIIAISDAIVPIKVAVFTCASIGLLGYHWHALAGAFTLIVRSAFDPSAFTGGLVGATLQQAVRIGSMQAIVATESGLGTAAVFFGFTGSKDPMQSGYMGMISTFISTLVCFVVAIGIVASGVLSTGLSSTALTIASFSTVFGSIAGWIVSFLSVSFGAGLIVAYAYVARIAWLFLTGNRFAHGFTLIYCAAAFLGAVMNIDALWELVRVVNAGMILVNLTGVLYLLPQLSELVNQPRNG